MPIKIGRGAKRRMMRTHDQLGPMVWINTEILEILVSLYFMKRTMPEANNTTIENLRAIHILGLLHKDIIIRLCKLDEDDNRSWSFRQAYKKLRKRKDANLEKPEVEGLLQRFRDLVRPLREHRDRYIAHLSTRDRADLLGGVQLPPAVRLAIELGDLLAGEVNSYKIEDFDLRADALDGSE